VQNDLFSNLTKCMYAMEGVSRFRLTKLFFQNVSSNSAQGLTYHMLYR